MYIRCKNFPKPFWFTSEYFVITKHQRTYFVKNVYSAYFAVVCANRDKCGIPQRGCYVCVEDLRKLNKICKAHSIKRTKKIFKRLLFLLHNRLRKKVNVYPNLTLTNRRVGHELELPVNVPPKSIDEILHSRGIRWKSTEC